MGKRQDLKTQDGGADQEGHHQLCGPVLHSPLLDRGTPGDVNPVPDVHLGLGEAAVVTIILQAFAIYCIYRFLNHLRSLLTLDR